MIEIKQEESIGYISSVEKGFNIFKGGPGSTRWGGHVADKSDPRERFVSENMKTGGYPVKELLALRDTLDVKKESKKLSGEGFGTAEILRTKYKGDEYVRIQHGQGGGWSINGVGVYTGSLKGEDKNSLYSISSRLGDNPKSEKVSGDPKVFFAMPLPPKDAISPYKPGE